MKSPDNEQHILVPVTITVRDEYHSGDVFFDGVLVDSLQESLAIIEKFTPHEIEPRSSNHIVGDTVLYKYSAPGI